jgi:hypothetical protein
VLIPSKMGWAAVHQGGAAMEEGGAHRWMRGVPVEGGDVVVGEAICQVPVQERVMRDGCAIEMEKKLGWRHRSQRRG